MSRFYTVIFENVAVAAAQDLFELQAADDKPIKIHQIVVTNIASETSDQLRFTIKRFTGAFTGGSVGTAPTPRPLTTSDPAAGFVAEVNNTTRATGGTSVTLWAEGQNALNGFAWTATPGAEIVAVQAEALVVGLEAAPAASTNMSGSVLVEEIG
jgi:hypothetical protein